MTNQTKTEIENILLSKHDFYFETPLYKSLDYKDFENSSEIFNGDVDAYSAINSTDTTYKIDFSWIKKLDTKYTNQFTPEKVKGFAIVTLKCKRKDNDFLWFMVYKDEINNKIIKVGQFPSLADLQFAELGKKYDKVLPVEDLKNLKKAIGLASHGAGAGSFVYIRRIFENLIFETYQNNKDGLNLLDADFKTKKMLDKIEAIKDFLPSQLIEMKGIYTILGKGVHELTEEECLQYFFPIKLSIELILDQKIEESKKKEKDLMVKQQLQKIQSEINKSK
ncbi:MAG: hypothetical protein PHS54_07420 [Clostridia bacterium]|nr:hypothetical protein [Clostridia bacterium]